MTTASAASDMHRWYIAEGRSYVPSEKISLHPEIAAALERVRVAGHANMRDVPQVLTLLLADEALDAADWVDTHRAEYVQGIARGFVIQDD
jgi:hypothetical protein